MRSRVAATAAVPIAERSADRAVRRLVRALSSSTFGHSPAATVDLAWVPGCKRQPTEKQPRRAALGQRHLDPVALHRKLPDDAHAKHREASLTAVANP